MFLVLFENGLIHLEIHEKKLKSLKVMKSKDEDLVDCGKDVVGSLFYGLVVRVMEVVKMWW